MTDQKLTPRQTINISLVLMALVSACFLIWQIWKQINQASPHPDLMQTSSPTITATATAPHPDTEFFAITTAETECFSGPDPSYQLVTKLPLHQPVMVLGKNSNTGDWFFLRWSGPDRDCWAPAYRLTPGFELAKLDVISTPLPLTSTLTPTITLTPTTAFVLVNVSLTPERTRPPKNTYTPRPTSTPTLTFTVTLTPSNTPTHTPTYTNTWTPTFTNTPTATFTQCVPPSAPNLAYELSTNKKEITLKWTEADRVESYQIYRSTNGDTFSAFEVPTTKRSTKDRKQPNDIYKYYVVAINSCGSAASNTVNIQR